MNIKAFNEDCVDLIGSQTFKNLTQGKKVCIVTDPPFIDELDSYSRIKTGIYQVLLSQKDYGKTWAFTKDELTTNKGVRI